MKLNQKTLIDKSDFDVLIILDACRYDYFKKVYKEFFNGNLKKAISPGSNTYQFYRKVFSGYFDGILISGNPRLNSKKVKTLGYKASDKFEKIVDVWYYGWDDDLQTVPPNKVSKNLKKYLGDDNTKIIAHYMQPHAPYIDQPPKNYKLKIKSSIEKKDNKYLNFSTRTKKIIGNVFSQSREFALKNNITRQYWKIKGKLGFELDYHRKIIVKFGVNGLRDLYRKNLIRALKSISKKLKNELENKKTIITSDHGEFLGDTGRFSHMFGCKHPSLIEVPWFEVNKIL